MFLFSSSIDHIQACNFKQQERTRDAEYLSRLYSPEIPMSGAQETLHNLSLSDLVKRCCNADVAPQEILEVYTKKLLLAHRDTNCVADFLVTGALHTNVLANVGVSGLDGDSETSETVESRPLLGVPISIKDTIDIVGQDTTYGLSKYVGSPVSKSAPIVRLMQDAGAIIMAKTVVPAGIFGMDTYSDLFGLTTNPYSPSYGVGASTGGGAALVGCRGVKIEIGSDVGGSLRFPAHFCGLYSLKGSVGRFPAWGNETPLRGMETIPLVGGAISGNLDDLCEFWQRLMSMKPWDYDFTCVPIPWRPCNLRQEGRKLKWGVIWEDGFIPPTPACRRALSLVINVLRLEGHEVVDFNPPVEDLLKIGYQFTFADNGRGIIDALQPSESVTRALKETIALVRLPRWVKTLISFFFRSSDPLYASMLNSINAKSIYEERELVVRRNEYRSEWNNRWRSEGIDFVLTVPFPLPALPNDTAHIASLTTAGYGILFNVLDFSAGVMPVTNVDKDLDALPANFAYGKLNQIAKGAYSVYDAKSMHGLPVGVQVAGRRFEEEKVLEGMQVIEETLKRHGVSCQSRNSIINHN